LRRSFGPAGNQYPAARSSRSKLLWYGARSSGRARQVLALGSCCPGPAVHINSVSLATSVCWHSTPSDRGSCYPQQSRSIKGSCYPQLVSGSQYPAARSSRSKLLWYGARSSGQARQLLTSRSCCSGHAVPVLLSEPVGLYNPPAPQAHLDLSWRPASQEGPSVAQSHWVHLRLPPLPSSVGPLECHE